MRGTSYIKLAYVTKISVFNKVIITIVCGDCMSSGDIVLSYSRLSNKIRKRII